MRKGLPIAALYLLAVVAVANLAFGAEFSSAGPFARPVGAGAYGAAVTPAAPVDPKQVARAITEANGGPPTVGQPRPAQSQSSTSTSTTTSTTTSSAVATTSISRTTTPTYNAVTKVSTLTIASLLAKIPTYLTFPPESNAHKRGK